MTQFFRNFLRDESGASAAEYALILAIVGAGIAGGAYFLGQTIDTSLRSTANEITSCTNGGAPTNGTC